MPKAQNPSVFSSSSFHHTRILSTILTQFTSPKTQLPTQTNCLLHFKKLVVTNNLLLLLRLLSLLQWS
ncbi:hypothetical protein CICLE_v10010122mg [Citrus x clementina]|uniref:Uncharacterized protein n=1 Tax=Citrus clementina TaxID=85681 RepID=V4USA5_CITCL|nr:hypothetical protein CICLE_v10010122mg [Citrus x clementina]